MDADPRRQLNLLKASELKALCLEHGLAVGGRKLELVERLVRSRGAVEAAIAAAAAAAAAAGLRAAPGGRGEAAAGGGRRGAARGEAAEAAGAPPPAGPSAQNGRGGGPEKKSRSGKRRPRTDSQPAASPAASPAAGRGRGRGQAVTGRGGSSSRSGRRAPPAGLNGDVGAGDRAAGSPAASRSMPLRCGLCTATFDPQSIRYTKDPNSFWCPPCRFKVMDPFNPVVEGNGMLKYAFFSRPTLDFNLDLRDLRQWRRDGLAVELRMLRVDCEKVCQAWPNSLKLLANGNEILEVKPPEEGHKRRDVPQNISPGLRPGANALRLKMVDDRHTDFAMAVLLTTPRGNPELSAQVRLCPETSARARVRQLLASFQSKGEQSEDIVCLTSDTLKLRCPITMERVEDPVRGEHCQHLQCFGLEAYLTSNRQMRAFNNRWQCPVCTLVLRPCDLCRDPYVARVLLSAAEDLEEVIVSEDGAWRSPGTPSSSKPSQMPVRQVQRPPEQAPLDLEAEAPPAAPPPPRPAPAAAAAAPPAEPVWPRAPASQELAFKAAAEPVWPRAATSGAAQEREEEEPWQRMPTWPRADPVPPEPAAAASPAAPRTPRGPAAARPSRELTQPKKRHKPDQPRQAPHHAAVPS